MVGRNYILSAANCFVNSSGDPFGNSYAKWRVIPSTQYADATDSNKAIDVRNIFVHKKYKGTDYRYNVAVLELDANIPIKKYQVVSLVRQPRDRTRVRAVGYGKIDDAKVESERLRMVDMVYRKFSWCNRKQQNAVSVSLNSARNLCAVSLDWPAGLTGVCDGDTGGPLYKIKDGSSLEQFAIYSFSSYGCGAYNAIPWFTRVKSFKNAIDRIVKNNFDGAFYSFEGDRQPFDA